MIREIMQDPLFLSRSSVSAAAADLSVADDLLDTLAAHREECVGMAANMIGVRKRIIAFEDNGRLTLMLNPEIIDARLPYETEEGCLSLAGIRKTKRFRMIRVRYQDRTMAKCEAVYVGRTAQIIQHEIDHCSGKLI